MKPAVHWRMGSILGTGGIPRKLARPLFPRSNLIYSRPLKCDLDPEADHIALVAYDEKRRSMDTRKSYLANIFQHWGIPQTAVTWFFDDKQALGCTLLQTQTFNACGTTCAPPPHWEHRIHARHDLCMANIGFEIVQRTNAGGLSAHCERNFRLHCKGSVMWSRLPMGSILVWI
jgi:hypothetical protein